MTDNRHAGSGIKVGENTQPSPADKTPPSVTESQSLAYVTIRNIESETSYFEQDWSLFVIKELQDNAWDWINEQYPITASTNNKDIRKIAVRTWITQENENFFIHIAVRNSNTNNLPVFGNLDKIFDYKSRSGTKRLQHRMTAGALGDALKRCLGMGYASWTKDFNPDESLEDKQWTKPLIIRHNGQEKQIFINVNIGQSKIWSEIEKSNPSSNIGNDTEVEVTLPITIGSESDQDYYTGRINDYHRKYKIGKSRNTDFSMNITNITINMNINIVLPEAEAETGEEVEQ